MKIENTKTEETATASLSQRAVACKHWRVLPGMRVLLEFTAGVFVWVRPRDQAEIDDLGAITRIDLDDPATLGCIEHGLLPEMYGDDCNLASWVAADGSTRWTLEYTPDPCSSPHQRVSVSDDGHESKGEALVFALEAAP